MCGAHASASVPSDLFKMVTIPNGAHSMQKGVGRYQRQQEAHTPQLREERPTPSQGPGCAWVSDVTDFTQKLPQWPAVPEASARFSLFVLSPYPQSGERNSSWLPPYTPGIEPTALLCTGHAPADSHLARVHFSLSGAGLSPPLSFRVSVGRSCVTCHREMAGQ